MTLTCFKDLCRRGMVSLEMIEYFFDRAGKAYLAGFETQRGMRYSLSTGKIIDESIKGRPILKYKITIEIE